MVVERAQPLLNPVLLLRQEARPESVSGGGKRAAHIRAERLGTQQQHLAERVEEILRARDQLKTFGGKVLLVASMFKDSFASSWTPTGLFAEHVGCRLVAPMNGGYLVEVATNRLDALAESIRWPRSVAARVDISRVAELVPFGIKHVLRRRSLDALWKTAPETEDGRLFLVWLVPFRDGDAREALMREIATLEEGEVLLPTFPLVQLPAPGDADASTRALIVQSAGQGSVSRAIRRYRMSGHAYASIRLRKRSDLRRLIASGAVNRIDPVRPIKVTTAGEGREPGPPPSNISNQPVVAVVDGGLTAASYRSAVAWRAPAFIADGIADHSHGNRVASLVVQAHTWNGNLLLPQIYCRLGIIQAVPKPDVNYPTNTEQFINYLRAVVMSQQETKVWSFAFNERDSVNPDVVSLLGHGIARIAREFDILPFVSVGNRSANGKEILCPPADCEAALVVGGRLYNDAGLPGEKCPTCLRGPGPEGMRKPDVSWFSKLRTLGGREHRGSSYPTGLSSALGAHAFAYLKEPTPDLVRALFLNTTELEEFDRNLGWGTPFWGYLPWHCRPGTVTLAWRSKLRMKTAYYWEGIPIPPQLVRNGKLYGKASLTAILKPITRDNPDANYFVTRVQVALQYPTARGYCSLLGTMKEDVEAELTARRELAKWQPVRCHRRDFTRRGGLVFAGNAMRLFARVYARDLYQFGLTNSTDLGEQEVAFVLSFSDGSDTSEIYDTMRVQLGTFVESALLESDVTVENEV